MTRPFHDEVLIRGDHVDAQGDYLSKEVLRQAVSDVQEKMGKGLTVLVTKAFSNEILDVQGIVSEIRIDGAEVLISGMILDTHEGLVVQKYLQVRDDLIARGLPAGEPLSYSVGGTCTPDLESKPGMRLIKSAQIKSVSLIPDREKIK